MKAVLSNPQHPEYGQTTSKVPKVQTRSKNQLIAPDCLKAELSNTHKRGSYNMK